MFLQLFNELVAATQLIIAVSTHYAFDYSFYYSFEYPLNYPFDDSFSFSVDYLLDCSFDYPFTYYTCMQSITHSTIQSRREPPIRLFLNHNRNKNNKE